MEANKYPGKLIAVEGLDGTGKTTQIRLLTNWLETSGWPTAVFKRKTSKLISKKINEAKKAKLLSPVTYSLIHAADFAEIHYNDIVPALKAGFVVIYNKYVYTAMAKDYLRGNEKIWIEKLYDFAFVPDLTVYFKTSLEKALENMTKEDKDLDYYDSGMDLGLASNSLQSLKAFQKQLDEQYEKMAQKYAFKTISNFNNIQDAQNQLRDYVKAIL